MLPKEATFMADTATPRLQLSRRLGRRIAERRKALAWTQDQLAERLRLDAESVSRFERGVTTPSLATLERLAKALKVRAADLLSEASTEPTDQAIRISAWLDGLSERDRAFALEQVKRMSEHFRKKT